VPDAANDPRTIKQNVASSREVFANSKLARFIPAIMTCMIWLYIVTWNHQPDRSLWDEIFTDSTGTKFWPMTLAMILGSLIAGSTPLGGGVVAFPIAVLVIGFSAPQGRDFAVLIQSVGMNAAGYLLILRKQKMLDFNLIAAFVVFGIPGVLIGLASNVPPFYIICTYMTLVLEFAIAFFYTNHIRPRPSGDNVTRSSGSSEDESGYSTRKIFVYVLMALFAFAGGFITSNVGSGSDILLYCFGLYVWDIMFPENAKKENVYTASSVVVMGILSGVTAICRALTTGFAPKVLYCLGSAAWLVCFGAPIGSMFLTPRLQVYLRAVFYILALVQFVTFGVLRIESDKNPSRPISWAIIISLTVGLIGLLGVHYGYAKRQRAAGMAHVEVTMSQSAA